MATNTLVLAMTKPASSDLVDESGVFGTNFDSLDAAHTERIVMATYGSPTWVPPVDSGAATTGILIPGFKASTRFMVKGFVTAPTTQQMKFYAVENNVHWNAQYGNGSGIGAQSAPLQPGFGVTTVVGATSSWLVRFFTIITSNSSGQLYVGIGATGAAVFNALRIIAEKADN